MRLIIELLLWIDQSPVRYWTVAVGAGAALLALCFWPGFQKDRPQRRLSRLAGHDLIFAAAIALTILAFRWPILSVPRDLNPDESSFISQALTLRHDPVFWRSISSGTSGPLNVYPLLLPWLFGFPINYPAARLVGLGCVVGGLIFFYLTCRRMAPPVLARLAVLPPLTFFSLATHPDFVHYSSEHVPLFLLSVAFYLAVRLSEDRAKLSRTAFVTGCVLGAVPFAKLQAVPAALVMTGFAYLFLLMRREEGIGFRLKRCAWLTAGGLTVPGLLLGITAAGGAFEHFWQSYIVGNADYVRAGSGHPLDHRFESASFFWRQYTQAFFSYFLGLLCIGIVAIGLQIVSCWREIRWNQHNQWLTLATAVLIAAGVQTVTPGRSVPHYLLFMVLPISIWAFAAVCSWLKCAGGLTIQKLSIAAMVIWCAAGVAWQVLTFPNLEARRLGILKGILERPPDEVAEIVIRFASRDEPLPVWGLFFDLNVQTGMGRATSDNYFDYLRVYDGSVPEYYRNLYIADIRRANPPVFVDAVAPEIFELGDRAQFGHETFLPLAKFIGENYVPYAEIRGIRIYVRHDRLRNVLKEHPEYALVRSGWSENSIDERIAFYRGAVALDPENESAHLSLGVALCQKGGYEQAIPHFRKASEIRPDYGSIYSNLGSALLQLGRIDVAEREFQKALKINSHDADLNYNFGELLSRQGRVEEAIARFEMALQVNPGFAQAHGSLANLLLEKGQLDRAITHYEEALRLNPADAIGQHNLGTAYSVKGRLRDAIRHFQKAVELQPDYAASQKSLAWLFATSPDPALRDGAKAIHHARLADQLTGGTDSETKGALAAAYAEAGRFSEALTTVRQAMQLAETANNSALAEILRSHVRFYQAESPLRP